MRIFLRAKIHHARVTDRDADYEGSIFIDKKLMESVDIAEFEKVLVINVESGQRWETYAGYAEEGSGRIFVNGGGAHLCAAGDRLIILAFAVVDKPEARPKMIAVDDDNKFLKYL